MTRSIIRMMLTRYLWLPLLGGAFGVGTAFIGAAMVYPRYVARVPFQVLPPPGAISAEPPHYVTINGVEMDRVICRQQLFWQQDAFFSDVLASPEFHPQDKPNQECRWLAANRLDPLKAIKRDLVLLPDAEAWGFEVRMTARDPGDAYNLVHAAVRVYLQRVRAESTQKRAKFLVDLNDAIKAAEADLEVKREDLSDTRRRSLEVLMARLEIEKTSVQDLHRELTLSETAATDAQNKYENISKRRSDGQDIELPPELQKIIEDDYTLKTLLNTRLAWEQERAARQGGDGPRIDEIGARLAKIDELIAERRKKLTAEAQDRYVEMLAEEAANKRALANYVADITKKREALVTTLGQELLERRQRSEKLKDAEDIVAKLRVQLTLAQTNLATDDTRIAKIDDPQFPTKPANLEWHAFAPQGAIGAASGMFIGLLGAWFFARRRAGVAPAVITSPPA
jgi:hypothetical protein